MIARRSAPGATIARRAVILVSLMLLAVPLIATPGADARPGITRGLADDIYLTTASAEWLKRSRATGAEIVRLPVRWQFIAAHEPAHGANPADPAYAFSRLDESVREAEAQGLDVLLMFSTIPTWAERAGRPSWAKPGTWKPDADAFGEFAEALARRYSGGYSPGGGKPVLPRVRYFDAFNEPNIGSPPKGDGSNTGGHLNPQWKGKKNASAKIYARMLNSLYSSVKGVKKSNKVVGPSTSPFGDARGGTRTRPVYFLRELFCLTKKLKKGKKCPPKPRFDILSHHPITLSDPPTYHAKNRDDATSGDMGRIKRVLKAAEKAGTVGGAKHHELWVTEFSWSSNPPKKKNSVSLGKQARWIQQALYLFWRKGVSTAFNFLVRDPDDESAYFQSGLYFRSGKAKPALDAFSFPFVSARINRKKLELWGIAPRAGKLKVQRKKGHRWKTLKRLKVKSGATFSSKARLKGTAKLRAKIGPEKSLVWKQGR